MRQEATRKMRSELVLFVLCVHFSAIVTNLSCIIAFLLWRPSPDQLPVFFVFPALWGMADAIWQTQTNGEHIHLHNDLDNDSFYHFVSNHYHDAFETRCDKRALPSSANWLMCYANGLNQITAVITAAFAHYNPDICPAALYGVLFHRDKEAAFANYRMWESLGFVIAFAYSTFLCLEYKLYILLAILVLTLITYPIVEYHEFHNPTVPLETVNPNEKKSNETLEAMIICQTEI